MACRLETLLDMQKCELLTSKVLRSNTHLHSPPPPGEDREALQKVDRQISEEEQKKMNQQVSAHLRL